MSITSKVINRLVEVVVHVPYSTHYDLFDHTMDWSEVVFSNRVAAIECCPTHVRQEQDGAYITLRLKQQAYDRLQKIIK